MKEYKLKIMNISSAIVLIDESKSEESIASINSIKGCEIALSENHKLVITIEAEDIAGETTIMKKVEDTEGVLSVKMVYAYSENELEAARENVEFSEDLPEWLNNENTDSKDIPYSGRLKM
jgi:nitrate reductase NapAB chaperone NapD